MLLTATLAVYAGATVVSFGFGVSTLEALPYGIFYALFIFFIDRSVLLTPRLYRRSPRGKVRSRGPGLATALRIFIAVCAALVVGETLMLRFFESSIAPRVTEIQQEELGRVMAEWDAGEASELEALAADLAAREERLAAAGEVVRTKTDEVNCQLAGGPGCLAGAGPIYQIKLQELAEATAAVTAATRERDAARERLNAFQAERDRRRAEFAAAQRAQIGGANDLLIREKAFWRLTLDDRSVLFWRIVLTLLLLGVDLAPLLFKRTLDRAPFRRRDRLALWREENAEDVEANQVGHIARQRGELAPAVAERLNSRYEDYVARREGMDAALRWAEDTADAVVAQEEIRVGRERRLRDLRRGAGTGSGRRAGRDAGTGSLPETGPGAGSGPGDGSGPTVLGAVKKPRPPAPTRPPDQA